jgi:hypothetical protein
MNTAILARLQSPGFLSNPITSAKMAGINRTRLQVNRNMDISVGFFTVQEYIMKMMLSIMV